MNNFHAPTLGIVELPALGELLRQMGYRVVSGATFPEAASAIKTTIDAAAADSADSGFPILIADIHRPGIKAWAQKHARTSPVLILRPTAEPYIIAEGAREIALPTTVGRILEAASLAVPADDTAALIVDADRNIVAPAAAAAAAAEAPALADDDFDFVETPPAAPAPAFELTAATEPAGSDQFFDTTVTPVPATTPAPEPAPAAVAPVRAPWDTRPAEPAAATVTPAPAPAPAFERVPQFLFPEAADFHAAPAAAPVAEQRPVAPVYTAPAWAASAPPVQVPRPARRVAAPVAETETAAPVQPAWAVAPAATPIPASEPAWAAAAPAPAEYAPAEVIEPSTAPVDEPTWAAAPLPAAVPADEPAVSFGFAPDAAPATAPERPNFFAAPGAAPAVDDVDLFGARPASAAHPGTVATSSFSSLAPVIFCWAYKGGVNKTSSALQLAHRAAEHGIRVWLIDMNRGQGGVRTVLRISETAPVRSAFDAARLGDPSRAFVRPDEVQPFRPANLEPIKFGLVLAPPRSEADPAQTPYTVYQQIIDHARSTGDLVIVDTQTVEAVDNSGLISNVMVPMMVNGAWGMAITEFAKESVENLKSAFAAYSTRGLRRDRQLLAVTRAKHFLDVDAHGVETSFNQYANFAGTTAPSEYIKEQFDKGIVVSDDDAVRPLLDTVLHRVTGDPRFDTSAPAARKGKRFGFFGGRK